VSDKRAPTPTGAAEFAVPVRDELISNLNILDNRMRNSIRRCLDEYKNKIEGLSRGIPNLQQILNESIQKLDYRVERLQIAIKNLLTNKLNALNLTEVKPIYINLLIDKYNERLKSLSSQLESVSADSVLRRRSAWVKGENSQTIYNLSDAQNQNSLTIRFADGELTTSTNPSKPVPSTPKAKKTKKETSNQTSLFDF
jgi:exodeoxyribonuclease VII large subunit